MGAEIHVRERSHCIQLTFICRERAQIQQNMNTANLGERLYEYSPFYCTIIGLKTFQNKTLRIRHDPSNSRRRLSFYPSSSYSKQKLSSFLLVCDILGHSALNSGSWILGPHLRNLENSQKTAVLPWSLGPSITKPSTNPDPEIFRGFFD